MKNSDNQGATVYGKLMLVRDHRKQEMGAQVTVGQEIYPLPVLLTCFSIPIPANVKCVHKKLMKNGSVVTS